MAAASTRIYDSPDVLTRRQLIDKHGDRAAIAETTRKTQQHRQQHHQSEQTRAPEQLTQDHVAGDQCREQGCYEKRPKQKSEHPYGAIKQPDRHQLSLVAIIFPRHVEKFNQISAAGTQKEAIEKTSEQG